MKWGRVLLAPLILPVPLRAGVSGQSGLARPGIMFPLGRGLYLHLGGLEALGLQFLGVSWGLS